MTQRTTEANSLLGQEFASVGDNGPYKQRRKSLLTDELEKRWDHQATVSASQAERDAQEIVLKIREHERVHLFGNVPGEAIPDEQSRDMGGRFLVNKPKILRSLVLTRFALQGMTR